MSHHLSWLEAGTMGALQGVSELFPISSLGHSVLVPALVGGRWATDLDVASPESPYLAFIVGTHVATALALVAYFWRDWVRLLGGLVSSLRHRRVRTRDERMIWYLVIGTIPVGSVGLVFEHWLRTNLGRPVPTACFLMVNGLILITIERIGRHRHEPVEYVDERISGIESDARLAHMGPRAALAVGAAQIAALAPGISRSGIATTAGMARGWSREDATRFSFLLATPVILAAGALKLPDLFGPLGDGIRPQIVFGSLLSGIGAYAAVRFLTRYVATRSLIPFGLYCLGLGAVALVWLQLR